MTTKTETTNITRFVCISLVLLFGFLIYSYIDHRRKECAKVDAVLVQVPFGWACAKQVIVNP